MMRPRALSVGKFFMARIAGFLVFLGIVHASQAGPITSNSALPVSDGDLIIRSQIKLTRSTDDPGPMDRNLTVWAFPTVLAYGVNEKFTLFGIFPIIDKSLDVSTPLGRKTRSQTGLGDLKFMARYTLGQWDRRGETLRLAPFAGLKVPTGEDKAKDSLGSLPQALQLGSGSWDPILGTVFSWQTLGWQLDTSATYKFNTEANEYEFGDEARLDLSYQYRLWPRQLGQGVPNFFYGVIESSLVRRGRDKAFGQEDTDTGGTTLLLAPGLQFVTKQMVFEAAIQIPLIQELNGTALKNDFILTTGFRIRF